MLFVICGSYITGGENNTQVDYSVNRWHHNNDVIIKRTSAYDQN